MPSELNMIQVGLRAGRSAGNDHPGTVATLVTTASSRRVAVKAEVFSTATAEPRFQDVYKMETKLSVMKVTLYKRGSLLPSDTISSLKWASWRGMPLVMSM